MKLLGTPDERFAGLPEYGCAPHYVDVPTGETPGYGTEAAADSVAEPDGDPSHLRIHHLDEGPPGAAETVLCLHGEPS